MHEVEIGQVTDFFAKPVVAGIHVTGDVNTGDLVRIKGHTTDLEFVLASMQIEHTPVSTVHAGDLIGIKVPDRVRQGDIIYKVIE
ncbi:MAG: translation elongation factor-like protein [Dehalococcoidia bacterium]|nr:translation elongation factor-like protein [Dehalococcoidia bacterium]